MTTMLREWQVNIPTLAEIQSEIEDLRALIESLSVNVKLDSHSVTAQQDQTEVEFPFSYDETGVLIIFRNGLLQRAGEQYDYVPVSNNKVSFNVPLEEGDVVTIIHISSSGPVGDTIGGGNRGSGNIDEDLRNLITQTAINVAKTNFKIDAHLDASRHNLSGLIIDLFNDLSGINEQLSRDYEYDPVEKMLVSNSLTFNWQHRGALNLSGRTNAAFAYDSRRNVYVIFGGRVGSTFLNDTWEFDGTSLRRVKTPNAPQPRDDATMVFDEKRGVMVLFGGIGSNNTIYYDTWEYDGTDWRRTVTSGIGASYLERAITYNPDIERVVAVAQTSNSMRYYEYDGSKWTQVHTISGMPRRYEFNIAYDENRGVLVLFGGRPLTGSLFNDTWEFDGTSWIQKSTTTVPEARYRHKMVYDRQRQAIVMFAGTKGNYGSDRFNDTWTYDGQNWTKIDGATSEPDTDQIPAYNSNTNTVVSFLCDSYGWRIYELSADSNTWVESVRSNIIYNSRNVYDSRRDVIVYFLSNATWEYDGTALRNIETATTPPDLESPIVYDSSRGVVVGLRWQYVDGQNVGETWEYDGTEWRKVETANVPTRRFYYSLAFDPVRNVVVLFGGYNSQTGLLNDTWEYDGVDWTKVETTDAPSPRQRAHMVYDEARQALILFGGSTSTSSTSGHVNDTWSYNGVNWTRVNTIASPPARIEGLLVYDPRRQSLILFSGRKEGSVVQYYQDVWEFDGENWQELLFDSLPKSPEKRVIAYSPHKNVVFLFGGEQINTDGTITYGEALQYWEFVADEKKAEIVSIADTLDKRPSKLYLVPHYIERENSSGIEFYASLDGGNSWHLIEPCSLIDIPQDWQNSDPVQLTVKAVMPYGTVLAGWAYGWV